MAMLTSRTAIVRDFTMFWLDIEIKQRTEKKSFVPFFAMMA